MRNKKYINLKTATFTMSKTNTAILEAQELFQRLPVDQQKFIKNSEPEVYKSIFGDEALSDAKILADFMSRYKIEKDLRSHAVDVFSKLDGSKPAYIKDQRPDLYEALFDETKSNNALLQEFLDEYEPLNARVTNFEEFDALSLEDQINFKKNFSDDYAKIISIEPNQEKK